MIYFDNASTSFPKAPNIKSVFLDYFDNYAVNINRSTYSLSYKLEEKIIEARESIKDFFNAQSDEYTTIFTSGVTYSLNLFINSVLACDDEVLISALEHNAVMRPLEHLRKTKNVKYIVLPYNKIIGNIANSIDSNVYAEISKLVTQKTKAIIINHISNVSGAINDIYSIGDAIKKVNADRPMDNQILYCIDSAGSAGNIPIDISKSNVDFFAFSSHKGLLALPGSGGAVVRNATLKKIKPLVFGGTGSVSHSYEMPEHFPDKLEAGTPNIFGIISLLESLKYINEVGLENILEKKKTIGEYFINCILNSSLYKSFKIEGWSEENGTNISSTVSLSHKNKDIAEIAYVLDKDCGISTRVGLQCAPLAHRTIGTFDKGGTLRFSFSHFNTKKEVDICIKALNQFL